MTVAEEEGWVVTSKLVELARAWFADPCSTLGCEDCFRNLRLAEARHQTNKETSPEKIQACAIKALNERYSEFELAEVKPCDYHGIRPGMFMKRSVFDCSRASACDTGISNFNQIMKVTTVSPHHLSRKSLTMWEAYKVNDGKTEHWWTAQLLRSGQAGFSFYTSTRNPFRSPFFCSQRHTKTVRFPLHAKCFLQIIAFLMHVLD
jgi:hypothetical protein